MAEFLQIELPSTRAGNYAFLVRELEPVSRDEVIARLTDIAGSMVVAELSHLSFIDVSGIEALRSAERLIERGGSRMEIRSAHGWTRRAFVLTAREGLLSEQQV
jgi:hypothetical protein